MDLHVRRQTLKFVSYLVQMCVFSHFVIDSSIISVIQFKVRVKYFFWQVVKVVYPFFDSFKNA